MHDSRLPLVSFTGSTKTGRHASKMVASRFGKTILELGGNNASIVMADADLDNILIYLILGFWGFAISLSKGGKRGLEIFNLLLVYF